MIDIVTPRGGKTHVRTGMNADTWSTLCGRKVVGYQGYTEAFTGDDICKQCAKTLPAAQAETEAVLVDISEDDELLLRVNMRSGIAEDLFTGQERHGLIKHQRDLRRAATKRLVASL